MRATLTELSLQLAYSFGLRILECYAKSDAVPLLSAFRYNEKIRIRR